MMTKTFDLADVLTLTTGVSVGDRKRSTLDGIISWVLGFDEDERISDFVLLQLADKATAEIFFQHPTLSYVDKPDFSGLTGAELDGAVKFWVRQQKKVYGRETVILNRG